MSGWDWLVLGASLAFIVAYGIWKGRASRDLDGYLLAGRQMRWHVVALSIMATQASAITFLSTPGQAFTDGMRFVQFYLGLPIAMVILAATAVPIYHRLKVYTAYEYLEGRFDLKTRALAALLFLIQRGLATGLTIFAPALVLSVLLGWNLYWTNLLIGGLVIIYTAWGGAKAVSWTQFQQMLIITGGMAAAGVVVVVLLPDHVSIGGALRVAGELGRLNAIDFSFDLTNRYNFWSGILGGCFLALAYFGTDQSQVGRYLTGRSVTHSRLGLLANGLIKVPMQFLILLMGVFVFAFYQFHPPPLSFNPVAAQQARSGPAGESYRALEREHAVSFASQRAAADRYVAAREAGDAAAVAAARSDLHRAEAAAADMRARSARIIESSGGTAGDANYVFLNFVIHHLPVGLVGLVLAAIFAASMSSTAAELNALTATTMVDIYRRLLRRAPDAAAEVRLSRWITVAWGALAVFFAEFASRLGTLVEAVNILGSLFYGTILGIFLVAFYVKRVRGAAVFYAALIAEAAVIACWLFTPISFLWYNVVGCLLVMGLALLFQRTGTDPLPVAP